VATRGGRKLGERGGQRERRWGREREGKTHDMLTTQPLVFAKCGKAALDKWKAELWLVAQSSSYLCCVGEWCHAVGRLKISNSLKLVAIPKGLHVGATRAPPSYLEAKTASDT
jgi:hypothetical protein